MTCPVTQCNWLGSYYISVTFSYVASLLVKSYMPEMQWNTYSVLCLVLQNKEESVPLSKIAMVPSVIPSHRQAVPSDSAKYRHKYKKLKQLVKETVFVSG